MAPDSVQQYIIVMWRFLSSQFPSGRVRLKSLRAKDVADFVSHDTLKRGRRSAQLMLSVLRSFLNFLFQKGRTATNLAGVVPSVAGWRLSELPRYLEAEQVEKILRSCDRGRTIGKRDCAILRLLARLGLRVGELAFLNARRRRWRKLKHSKAPCVATVRPTSCWHFFKASDFIELQ
ncbi:MAG: hypothetical protein MUE94_09795 [Verrucomicrobia bacterium]|nr:hypothetical protein [Verrucomicrobiota bacterium]